MAYSFGDFSTNIGGGSDSGLDLGFYSAQDVSVDDVYSGTDNSTTGWASAVSKIGDVFGNVMDTGGNVFNSYVDKLLDREVYGSNWFESGGAEKKAVPINKVAKASGIDTKTLVIGGVVLAAFALIALKK